MNYEYGVFSNEQMKKFKEKMRRQIFYLLLIVDPETKDKYSDTNVEEAFQNVLRTFGGYNDLLHCPTAMVTVLSLVNAARLEYLSKDFKFSTYRKLILDAGCEVLNIEEVTA